MEPTQFDRRSLIIGAGVAALAACSSDSETTSGTDSPPSASSADTAAADTTDTIDFAVDTASVDTASTAETDDEVGLTTLTPADFASLAVCAMLPSSAAGPFPTPEQLDRRDVTEGYPGEPLRLGVRVVDTRCAPIPGAEVEIWHTDATGDYSAYTDNGSGKDEGEGTTFLRGFQSADADGIAEFQTIYPGWYEGRAVHIHVTVRIDGVNVLTSQLYFDEAYTAQVYAAGEYEQFGLPDTSWADDRLIGDPATDGSGITLSTGTTALGPGTLGLVNVGVNF